MNDIVIIGAGGLAREVAFLIESINLNAAAWKILGFVDKDDAAVGRRVGKYPILCKEDDLLTTSEAISVVIGIGDPLKRMLVVEKLQSAHNLAFPNLIHPGTVWDKESIILGRGNVICAGNIFTTDISVGSFNYFGLNCTYGHDVEIGDCCVLNPGINVSGGVKIGTGCMIGTGATILQYLNIEKRAIVGAGAVVIKDVAAGSIVAGVPAKQIK